MNKATTYNLLSLGSGVQYESPVSLGYLNQSFQNAVRDGIRYGLEQGLFGWNVTDCKICFEYGLYYSPVSTHLLLLFLIFTWSCRAAAVASKASSFSPVPTNLIGLFTTVRIDKAAPPRVSPSNFVSITPSKSKRYISCHRADGCLPDMPDWPATEVRWD